MKPEVSTDLTYSKSSSAWTY